MMDNRTGPAPEEGDPTVARRRPDEVTVLVVDDEPDVVTFLSSVLEDAGINVLTAYDGDEALEVLRAHPVDLISLDLVMPRKSGIRLWVEIRKTPTLSRIPVVFVTGHAKDPGVRRDIAEAMQDSTMMGPSLYIEKPVTPRKYLTHICSILKVELPEGDAAAEDPAALRQRAMEMLKDADPGTLEAVLEQLKKSGP